MSGTRVSAPAACDFIMVDASIMPTRINAPFGLKLVYDDGWVGRFQALHSEIETINCNPSLAIDLSVQVTLGSAA